MSWVLLSVCLTTVVALLSIVGWATWVTKLLQEADETPLVTPELSIAQEHWKMRLPGFRRTRSMLEQAGYRHLGYVDERYHPRFVIQHGVFWNSEVRSYALLFSVWGRARFMLLGTAGNLLIRTGATERPLSTVGPLFVDGGHRERAKRIAYHHETLDHERLLTGAEPQTGEGNLPHVVSLLRARAVRGAPQETPFVFGAFDPQPDDSVERVPICGSAELLAWYHATFNFEFKVDSWSALFVVLAVARTRSGGRIVLVHERHPLPLPEFEEYEETLHDACWRNESLVVVFEQRLS